MFAPALSGKRGHSLLAAFLEITALRHRYTEQYARLQHQRDWIITLDRCFEPEDERGQRRTVRQVKQDVTEFLEGLTQEAKERPAEAKIIAHIIKAVRHRWWGLFTCYRIPNVPSSNNDLETFFTDLKHHQRRITGRKSVREFMLRYGPFAAFIDYAESFDDLIQRLRQVKLEEFVKAQQALQKVDTRLKKLHRFRHHPDEYYRDLETRWAKAISAGRT
jgi:hypothetical protein